MAEYEPTTNIMRYLCHFGRFRGSIVSSQFYSYQLGETYVSKFHEAQRYRVKKYLLGLGLELG